jgi:hypothetical protein
LQLFIVSQRRFRDVKLADVVVGVDADGWHG